MPKRLRDKRVVVVLRAFFDESAISPIDGPYLIMGGYVGKIDAFEQAAEDWQACLDEPPSAVYFHHKDPRCADKIMPLARIVAKQNLQPFVITIPHAPFKNRDSKLTRGLLGTRVYDWGFINTVRYVLYWADKTLPEGERVDFIFEKRSELELCRKKLYDPLADEGIGIWKRAGTCTSETNKRVGALQMGDLLAGQSLESIRCGSKTPAIEAMEEYRQIIIINEKPLDMIERNLTLQSLGGKIFNSGLRKILAQPKGAIDPALYDREYQALRLISAIVKSDAEALKRQENIYYANASKQPGVHKVHEGNSGNDEGIEDGNAAAYRGRQD